MKLKKYFDTTGITISFFANKIGVDRKTIHNALNGNPISLTVALKIEKGTEGKVTIEDLISPHMRK